MSEPFLSEIKIMSFNFPPKGWALCNGQLLPINQNQALFALLGTTYGGNGTTNFALPNIRGRTPIHTGNGHTLGEAAGSTSVTLTTQQLPQHIHQLQARNNAADLVNGALPGPAKSLAQAGAATANPPPAVNLYAGGNPTATMGAASCSNTGGNQPHNNMMPYLTLNYCIALQGIFPSQN